MSITEQQRDEAYTTLYTALKGRESGVISSDSLIQTIKRLRKELTEAEEKKAS